MSSTSTPNDSPISSHIQPLHNPENAAKVVVPQAPLGNATNSQYKQAPSAGAKALFEKRFAKGNTTYVSPTDSMMTPTTQKINAAKKNRFNKGAKPMPTLFQQKDAAAENDDDGDDDDDDDESPAASNLDTNSVTTSKQPIDTDDNPF